MTTLKMKQIGFTRADAIRVLEKLRAGQAEASSAFVLNSPRDDWRQDAK
jgi:hypothetical protein